MSYRKIAICLLMMAGMSTWSHAQAQQTICSGATVPTGWVIIDVFTEFGSCGGFTDDAQTIENISTINTAGAKVSACAEGIPIPANWVVQDVSTSSNCGQGTNNVDVLFNLKGFAVGTQESVCAGNTLPSGWSIISTSSNPSRCGGGNNDIDTIRRNF